MGTRKTKQSEVVEKDEHNEASWKEKGATIREGSSRT